MANTLRFKRGLTAGLPASVAGEPLFTTDTFDLYIGNGTTNTRFQKYIASGTTLQYLRGDGTLATFPILTGFVPYTGATANVDLGVFTILAQNATIASSGSGNTATITHSSGSGIALNITKGGNGEGLYVNKTSGSGNAATILGTLNATTLVKSGGLSTEYLKADGSVSTLTNPITGTGASGQVAYWSGASTQAGNNNLFWDNTNGRLGIGTITPSTTLDIRGKTKIETPSNCELDFVNSANSMRVSMGSTIGFIGTLSNNSFAFFTAATERARFHAGGNFHLGGTADSGQRLQVTGDGYFSGSVGIGQTTLTGYNLRISSNITGVSSPIAVFVDGQIQASANGATQVFRSSPTLIAGAAISEIRHFSALQGTIGAGATIGGQTGFFVHSSMTGATNNWAFYGDLAAATGRWNLYMNGTAANYLNGELLVGSTASTGQKFQVTGTAKITDTLSLKNGTTSSLALNFTLATTTGIYANDDGVGTNLKIQASGQDNQLVLHRTSNVIIGSATNTGEKLQVNGTMKVTGASTFGGNLSVIKNSGSPSTINVTDGTNTTSTEAYFQATAGTTQGFLLSWGQTKSAYKILGAGDVALYKSNTAGDVALFNDASSGSIKMAAGGSSTAHFTIASTGASTFSSNVTMGDNLIVGTTATTIGAMNFIRTNTSPVASRLTFGTDGTGYSFVIGKNQAGTVTDFINLNDSGNFAVDSNVLFVDAVNNEVGIGTNAPNSVLQIVGSVSKSISDIKTANYTATATDHTILCSAASGGFTITLPASSGIAGRIYVIKKTNASSGVGIVTVDGNASETIDGSASIDLSCKSSVTLQCDGSNWHILTLYTDTSCI